MSEKFDIKEDRLYTKDHEWALTGADGVQVGITAYAVDQLGDITLVNLDVKAGDAVTAGKAFGTIESVKTLSDLYSPVSGKVAKVNGALESQPELVNEDCYGKGWMLVISPSNAGDDPGKSPTGGKDELLSPAKYGDLLKSVAH